jgi:tetratricopeptide (TPR) repeat protein
LADALAQMEKAVELRPDYGEAHSNLGNVLRDLGRIDDAHAAYGRALDLIPSDAHAHVNRAVALLLAGDFAAGWEEYEWRLETPEARDVSGLPARWDAEPLDGKSILVYTEQGVGDVVMFASILPDLIDTSARVHLWSTDRLTALLARSYPDIDVVRLPEVTAQGQLGDDAPPLDGIDFSVAIASLPRTFRRSRGDFDDANSKTGGRTLTPEAAATERWKRRYEDLGRGLKIGISWRGGVSQWDKRLRTTRLDDWTELLKLPEVVWINLQYGDRAQELSQLEEKTGHKVHDWPDALADLDDFAAQLDALDLVISMDNSTVHFAGALAKPVRTLVPAVSAWRWGLSGHDCPWYPTMRLIRQGEGQPWSEVLAPLASDIADIK